MKNRFRFKLTTSFVATAIIPLLVMGIVAVATIYQTRMQNVVELENQSLLQIKEKINKFILEKVETTKLKVKGAAAKGAAITFTNASNFSHDQVKFFLDGFNEEIDDVIEIAMLDKSGEEVGKLLNYQGKTYYLGQEEKKDIAKENSGRLILISQKDLPTYKEAIKSKESIYYSPIEQTPIGPILIIATPIVNDLDQVIGVTVVKIKTTFLMEYLEQKPIGQKGYFLLVDRDGYFISNGNKWNDVLPLFQPLKQVKKIDIYTKSSAVFYEQRDINNQQVIIGEILAQDDAARNNMRDLGWKIIAVWPKNDAFAVVQVVVLEIILTTIVSLLIVLILSALLSRQVVKPIELLGEKADLIGQGKFEQEIKIKTNDEIEELGESFNKMAKGLQEIQKLKDEFVFIAAHELRTPVTIIKGYLSLALDGDYGKLSTELEETLKKVDGANTQLVQLVNDLLEIARAEAGRTKIKLTKINLATVVQRAVSSLNAWAETEKIKLIYEKPSTDFEVMADENKLMEVLNNFGSNAIKYNRPGGTVTIRHKERGGEVVTIIQDTGIGLTKEELSHLFEKFYRAENDDTAQVGGTGLGLFIVKQLIEKMGGRVEAASERGKGSTFSFTLKKA